MNQFDGNAFLIILLKRSKFIEINLKLEQLF